MEKHLQQELATLTEIIAKTVPVSQIILFGSFARGQSHPDSDLDIYVVMPEGVDMREIDAIKLIRRAIRHVKSKSVDVMVSKEGKFNIRKSSPTFERAIAEEGIVIYG